MSYLEKVVYLTEEQYGKLAAGTLNGHPEGVQNNTLYVTTDQQSLADLSGILPVNKGGTGATTLTSGNLLVGSGTAAVTTIGKDSANVGGTVVVRDSSGNFSANTITANLTGTATTATVANELASKTLTTSTINSTAGNYAFYIASTTQLTQISTSNADYVGLQIGNSYDKWQLTAISNSLFFRQNDSGGTNTSWNNWVKLLDSVNYTNYTVTKTGEGASGTWGISITGDAGTVNGHTIAHDVPSDAVFTDTTSFTITANATDGYWDLTGTNGTNAVTYALAPYSSKQSGANFYTGTTAPDGTTRLNYNGYFYGTKLYSGGTEVSVSGHTHSYAGSSSAGGAANSANALNFVHTNEILIGNTNAQAGIHINHRRVSGGATSGNTAITDYYFKNGNGAVTGVTIHAASFDGNLTGNAASATQIKATLDTTHKTYLLGTQTEITSTTANVSLTGDTGVYLNTSAGSLSAKYYQINDGTNEKVTLQWNSTDFSLDFIFA